MNDNIVYFCQSCGKVEFHSRKIQRIKCPDCGSVFVPTKNKWCDGISKEQYDNMLLNNEWEDYIIEHYSRFYLYAIQLKKQHELKNFEPNAEFIPKCPTCGCTEIRKISATEKAVNIGIFGLLGNKRKYQFECLNPACKYKW